MAVSIVSGLAKERNLSFDPSDIADPNCAFVEKCCMGIGALSSINPTKILGNAANIIRKFATKEALEVGAKTIVTNGANVATSSFNLAMQKGKQVAGNVFEKNVGKFDLDTLSRAGQVMDGNGMSKAGRALQKHGDRAGSAFPKAFGNAKSKNAQGQFILDDLLTHPKSFSKPNNLGGLDYFGPNGSGVRFYADGKFRGFLEPNL